MPVAPQRAVQQELIKAWLAQDRPAIERLLTPDWTLEQIGAFMPSL